jgi:hypothetical protein
MKRKTPEERAAEKARIVEEGVRLDAIYAAESADIAAGQGLAGAARNAAREGKKIFACRIPWTKANVNIAFSNSVLPKVSSTIEDIEAHGWRLDMIGTPDIYIFRRVN